MSHNCIICNDNDAKHVTDLTCMSFLTHLREINSQIRKKNALADRVPWCILLANRVSVIILDLDWGCCLSSAVRTQRCRSGDVGPGVCGLSSNELVFDTATLPLPEVPDSSLATRVFQVHTKRLDLMPCMKHRQVLDPTHRPCSAVLALLGNIMQIQLTLFVPLTRLFIVSIPKDED